MKHKAMNNAIRQAFTKATPDVLDSVLSNCAEQKGTVIVMTERKRISWGKKLAAAAAVLTLIVGIGIGAGNYYINNTVASTISLDVNPSIELRVNRNERVLEAEALNADARTVLGEMDLEGSDLDVAVNAIIGSMLRNGYISEIANSILISVDSKDAASAAALQDKLTAEINALLNTDSFTGAVLSQTVTHETELEALASQYGITLGKAQLISRIVAQDSRYTFEKLANLSINELNLLSQSAATPVEDVATVGTPSEKEYIGADAAKHAALTHAGDNVAERAVRVEVEMDCEDGIMIYEVEFTVDGYDYDYEINAKTGAVLKSEKEKDDDYRDDDDDDVPVGTTWIGEDAALSAALTHAGLSKDQIRDLEIELDEDDGTVHYDVDFENGAYDYSYEIDAKTGAVLKSEKDRDDDLDDDPNTPNPPDGLITGRQALETALQHAGLTEDQVYDVEIDLDDDDDEADHYDVEFKADGYEYEYKVAAYTPNVLENSKEPLDD